MIRKLLVLLLIVCACKEHPQQDLISILNPSGNCKSSITSKFKGQASGFMSSIFILYSDSTYLREYGGEGWSRISVGRWQVIGDSVRLYDLRQDEINPICHVLYDTTINNSDKVTLRIIDKKGKPFEQFTIVAYDKRDENGEYKGDGGEYRTKMNGLVTIDGTKYDSLFFEPCYTLAGKEYRISTRSLPDTITLYLDFEYEAVVYYFSVYEYKDKKYKTLLDSLMVGMVDSIVQID